MRRKLTILLLAMAMAAPVAAQQRPQLEPIPEPPPPPPPGIADESFEPEVTILQRGEDKVEEFRIRGRLYMVKVTPPGGAPYYLVDQRGDGVMVPYTHASPTLSVPMWVVRSW